MDERKRSGENRRLQERLEVWKRKIAIDESAWAAERKKMDWRTQLFEGTKEYKPVTDAEDAKKGALRCHYVRNVIQENIETMIDSHIPAPKVTPLRRQDEALARSLEHLLRFYVARRHLRVMNDLAERVSYVQGGVGYLAEWDNSLQTPDGLGDVQITLLHPKNLIPQEGIFTDVPDMDHVTVKLAVSRQTLRRRFGVELSGLREQDPGVRGADDAVSTASELVTLYTVYYRNDKGGVGMFAWVDDVVVADLEDYQARRMRRCRSCGALDNYVEPEQTEGDDEAERLASGEKAERVHRCAFCEGTEFEDATVDEEEIYLPMTLLSTDGVEIELEGARSWIDETGRFHMEPRSTVPYYKPDLLPVILQKNVSRFGRLLGESDVDRMEDAQNLIKRMDKKTIDRLVKAGTKITMPADPHYETDLEDQEVIRVDNVSHMQMFKPIDLSGDVTQVRSVSEQAYETARQATGVTDSMQGRRDPTATSARAKEFAANKSEGRMESKRVMKREAWAKLYEIIAKLFLANCDEPLHLRVPKPGEEPDYETFDRKKFLKQGRDGRIYYETGFIFDCDDALLLGDSRESMWRELKEAFNGGTLGDPSDITTRILYWGLLEEQGYPGAAAVKRKMEEQKEMQMQAPPAANPNVPTAGGQLPPMPAGASAIGAAGMPG